MAYNGERKHCAHSAARPGDVFEIYRYFFLFVQRDLERETGYASAEAELTDPAYTLRCPLLRCTCRIGQFYLTSANRSLL